MKLKMVRGRKVYWYQAGLAGLVILASLACQALAGPNGDPTEPRPPTRTEPARQTSEADPSGTQAAGLERTPAATRDGISDPLGTPRPAGQPEALLPGETVPQPILESMSQYTITVEVQFDEQTYQGRQQIAYLNAEDTALESIYLRLLPNGGGSYGSGSLSVTNLTLDGQPVETGLSVSDSALEVMLPAPLEPGAAALLEMDFEGDVPSNFSGQGYGIYNFTDGVLSMAGWHPILAVYDEDGWNLDPVSNIGDSVYADDALYFVDVTVDRLLTLAATGSSVSSDAAADQTHQRLVSGPAREFYLVMSPQFEVESAIVNGTTINSYFYPEHGEGGRVALDVAAQSLEIFNQRFGVYPYAELDVVEVPMEYAAGVEFPGIILVLDELYEEATGENFFAVVVAHEVAHQWWYNLVGNDVFDEPWLDEALTTYSASLYFEDAVDPRLAQGMIESFEQQVQAAVESGNDDLVTESLDHFEEPGSGDYSVVVYTKGALFFAELREEIGEQDFFEALQSYFSANRYQTAAGEELLAAFEQAAGRQLDDFYQEWLYSKAE